MFKGPFDHFMFYMGLSTDTKPTVGVALGSRFFETNTKVWYIFDSSSWSVLPTSNTLSMNTATDPATNAAVTTAIVDSYGGSLITLTGAGNTQTLQSPTLTTAGKIFTVVNNDTSTHSVSVVANSVTFTITAGESQPFIWDGSAWGPTDIGITAIPVTVSQGGTGLSTITDHGIMLGSGTSAVTPMSVGTNGQLVKGVTSADPTWSTTTLTDGSNESTFTNGTGSLKFETGSSVINQDVTTDGNPQFGTIELGHASDTTLTRVSAGVAAIEGKNIYLAGGTDVAVADGGTNKSSWTQYSIPYASATTTIGEIAPAASSVLVSSAGTVPSMSTALPNGITATTQTVGDNTTKVATDAYVDGTAALSRNSKAFAQGVYMTAGTSSSGITVADNTNINLGTGNYTLVWNGIFPDYASANALMMSKYQDASNVWYISGATANKLLYRHYKTGGTTVSTTTTVAHTLTAGTPACIIAVITRETAAVAGSAAWYINGQLLESVAITAGTPANIDNTGSLQVSGYSTTRYNSVNFFSAIYNRALTAAEVLDLYRNGINYADKWGSQTELVTGTNSDMSGSNSWTQNLGALTFDVNSTVPGKMYLNFSSGNQNIILANVHTVGKRYRMSLKIRLSSGTAATMQVGGHFSTMVTTSSVDITGITNTEATYTAEYDAAITSLSIGIVNTNNNGSKYEIDDVTVKEIGATLALEPEGITDLKWINSSSNIGLDASYPSVGWSLIRNYERQKVSEIMSVEKNNLINSQSVNLTYAGSGSTGIIVFDNDNIDLGTSNFSLVRKLSVPLWINTTTNINLINKWATNVGFSFVVLITTGVLRLYINATYYDSTISLSLSNNTNHLIGVSVVRETSSSAGTITFMVDGYQFGSVISIPAASTATISNATNCYISGTSAIRTESDNNLALVYNKALTTTEFLSLYRNGINYSDKWGSQVSLITGDNSTFASDTGWWTKEAGWSIGAGVASCSGTNGSMYKSGLVTLGKRYKVIYTITSYTSGSIYFAGFSSQLLKTTTGTFEQEGIATGTFGFGSVAFTGSIDDVFVYEVGATLALEPEGIQPAPGQWLDSSTNKLHAMQPASGSSLVRSKKDFEYRWTNTWTASSAAQYVGGLNQAVLSADHFITSVTTQATVTTDVENLELGDGSDVNHFVEAFAPSATRTNQTIANQNDGTNLKLVYTPAAEATMTVETIIRGYIWEN